MNLYFIPGAFFCFYKCWHLFQQQQVIHFWILSHLKLLELLNSQGQHWVMFLTEKLFFVFHQKKIHVNAFLPNDHFFPSHLIIYFFPISEYIFFSYNAGILCSILVSFFLCTVIEDIFPSLKEWKALKTAWTFSSPASSHLVCLWPVTLSPMHWVCPESPTEQLSL